MLYIRGMIRGWGLICEMNQMAMLAPLTHDSCVPGQASRKKKEEVTAESDWEIETSVTSGANSIHTHPHTLPLPLVHCFRGFDSNRGTLSSSLVKRILRGRSRFTRIQHFIAQSLTVNRYCRV